MSPILASERDTVPIIIKQNAEPYFCGRLKLTSLVKGITEEASKIIVDF